MLLKEKATKSISSFAVTQQSLWICRVNEHLCIVSHGILQEIGQHQCILFSFQQRMFPSILYVNLLPRFDLLDFLPRKHDLCLRCLNYLAQQRQGHTKQHCWRILCCAAAAVSSISSYTGIAHRHNTFAARIWIDMFPTQLDDFPHKIGMV